MTRVETTLSQIRQLEASCVIRIPGDFLDENQHVNVQYYLHLVELGLSQLFAQISLGELYAAADVYGNFALEQHIRYFAEILLEQQVSAHIRLIELSPKRAYFMGFLVNDSSEKLAAIVEIVMMNVDMSIRRGAPFPAQAFAELEALLARHKRLAWPAPVCGIMRA